MCIRDRDDLGLESAIEWLSEEFEKHSGTEIHLVCSNKHANGIDISELNSDISTAAFRIVQECLTNIAKHAQASFVKVTLECDADHLTVNVSDNGQGVEPGFTIKRHAYGQLGMQERVRNLGGTYQFTSASGEGATVHVVLPLKQTQTIKAESEIP